MTTHFIPVNGSERASCGRHIQWSSDRAEAPRIAVVDCQRCMSTSTYRTALSLANSTVPVSQVDARVKEEVQRILTIVANRANAWANDAGHCDTYDEAVEEIQNALPSGYEFPGRKRTFRLRFREFEVEANSEQEATEIVEEDIWNFVSIDS